MLEFVVGSRSGSRLPFPADPEAEEEEIMSVTTLHWCDKSASQLVSVFYKKKKKNQNQKTQSTLSIRKAARTHDRGKYSLFVQNKGSAFYSMRHLKG